MFENKAKGWYGSLSRIGKNAAIHAFLKLAGFNSGLSKAKKKKTNINSDSLSSFRDNLITVKKYQNSVKLIKTDPNKNSKKENIKKKEKVQYHFHSQTDNNEESKYYDNPTCTKYTPNFSLVFPKLLTGPVWTKVSGRKYKKVEFDEKDFLITHDSAIDNESKCLVNMNRTTQRGNLFENTDPRFRTEKKFIYKSSSKKKRKTNKSYNTIKDNKDDKNEDNKGKNLSEYIKSNYKTKKAISLNKNFNNKKQILIQENIKENNINLRENNKKIKKDINKIDKLINETVYSYKNSDKKNIQNLNEYLNEIFNSNSERKKSHLKNNKSSSLKSIQSNYDIPLKNINNVIDFKKTISREKISKINTKEQYLDIVRIPNYSYVRERPIMLTFYNTKKNSNFLKTFDGIDQNFFYDANKAYYFRRDHSCEKVPDFNLILPRPNKENTSLPTFMQKIFDREAIYALNDKTLELNEYSKQKLGNAVSTFFPKPSFNNLVNMKMLVSNNFNEDYNIDDVRLKKEEIKMKMKFRHKSLGKLVKEGGLKKFDSVTFKTIYKAKNYLNGDLNKYLLGLKK